jgi:hypothetical protein
MSFEHIPGVGMVHFQTVKAARVVPGHERHKWDGKPAWGESATCLKCGCVKHRLKTQPDYTERYQLAGTTAMLPERPACTGTPKPTNPNLL